MLHSVHIVPFQSGLARPFILNEKRKKMVCKASNANLNTALDRLPQNCYSIMRNPMSVILFLSMVIPGDTLAQCCNAHSYYFYTVPIKLRVVELCRLEGVPFERVLIAAGGGGAAAAAVTAAAAALATVYLYSPIFYVVLWCMIDKVAVL